MLPLALELSVRKTRNRELSMGALTGAEVDEQALIRIESGAEKVNPNHLSCQL